MISKQNTCFFKKLGIIRQFYWKNMKNEKYLEILKKNEKVSFATHVVKAISNSYFLEKHSKQAKIIWAKITKNIEKRLKNVNIQLK